jgi:methylisocitrate lyase
MIFAEALCPVEDYRAFARAVPVPVPALPNIAEFGKTPLFTVEELRGVRSELSLRRRQVGSIIYEKSESLNL